jgi:hypothetical protein
LFVFSFEECLVCGTVGRHDVSNAQRICFKFSSIQGNTMSPGKPKE